MRLTKWQKDFGRFASKGGQAFSKKMRKDPEFRKRMCKHSQGDNNPSKKSASRLAISEGLKRSWKNKEHRRKRELGMQKAWDRDYEWRSVVSDETCKKLSKTMKGRDPVGRPRGPRTVWYVGTQGRVAMRSKDEVRYAKMLDKANIKWLYECCTFTVGNKTWTPDFYLPVLNRFVEVKGWLLDWVRRKIEKVIRHYASTKFELVRSDKLALPV